MTALERLLVTGVDCFRDQRREIEAERFGRFRRGKNYRDPSLRFVQEDSKMPMTRQAVTKHLQVLERAGLVRCERSGRERRFEFAPERVEEMRKYLEFVSAKWDAALGRLEVFCGAMKGLLKADFLCRLTRRHVPGIKVRIDFVLFMPGLKSRPISETATGDFFSSF